MPLVDTTRLLADLVRLPSVNPMGKPAPFDDLHYEHRVTDYLEALLKDWGLPTERVEVHPGRDNLITGLPRTAIEAKAPLILLEVHQDTVPVDGMTIDPFAAKVENGRLYGRGACDVKGGMAAMLAALARLIDQPRRSNDVAVAFTINEEFGFTGATKLIETWSSGNSRLLPRRPDAIIVAEPTNLEVVVAHKGVVRWRCEALGRAGHSSQPQKGKNAIYTMSRAVGALEEVAAELANQPPHPLLGPPSLSVGTIAGGVSVNTVPDHCVIEIDRRLLPGESPTDAYQAAIAKVASQLRPQDRVQHSPPFITSKGLRSTSNQHLAASLSKRAAMLGDYGKHIGVPFGTDAAAFDAAGASAVVFGPGNIAQAHTADEWIELNQLDLAAKILTEFCLDFNSALASD